MILTIRKMQLKYPGYIMWKESMEKRKLTGHTEAKRNREYPYIKGLCEWMREQGEKDRVRS